MENNPEPEESGPENIGEEEESMRRCRIRKEAESLADSVLTKEAKEHFVRAATELLLAADSMVPRDRIPPDVKEHYVAVKREGALLIKAIMDAQLKAMDDLKKEKECPEGLRKIDLD